MFRDKTFNISLFISLTWHICCIYAVVVVVLPKGFDFAWFPTISFLGPILEDGILASDILKTQTYIPTPYKRSLLPKEGLPVFGKHPTYDNNAVRASFKKLSLLERNFFTYKKRVPVFEQVRPKQTVKRKNLIDAKEKLLQQGIQIEKDLSKRGIVYAPHNIKFPKWTKSLIDSDFNIRFKVFVSPSGNIERIDRLISSGYPKVDLLAMQYIRDVVFEQLPGNSKGKIQEGVITVNFK